MDNANVTGQSAAYLEGPKEEDVVNHPSHYQQYSGFEVIDVCEQLRAPDGSGGYNRGNAFKYLARAGWKNPDKHVEDLEKAKFYIQREIDRIQSDNWMNADPIAEVLRAARAIIPESVTKEFTDGLPAWGIQDQERVYYRNQLHDTGRWAIARTNMSTLDTYGVHHCPSCGIRLLPDLYCPNDHGWLGFPKGSDVGIWFIPTMEEAA